MRLFGKLREKETKKVLKLVEKTHLFKRYAFSGGNILRKLCIDKERVTLLLWEKGDCAQKAAKK